MGFAAVLDSASLFVFDYHITMSHFPLAGIKREKCENFATYQEGEGWHGEFRYRDKYQVLEDSGQDIHLHGHLHSPNNGHSERIQGKQFDVGVDANNLRPISLNYIIKTMKQHKPL
jgi:calcineurin-like phosphoesterase family protein